MALNIIKGAQRTLFVRLTLKTGDPMDLTNTETIRACFPRADGTKLYKGRILKSVTTVNGSDVLTCDTDDLFEGAPVAGTGIPVGATVLKTPSSTTSPSAVGTVQISLAATASGTVTGTFGDVVFTGNPLLGKFQIPLDEAETDSLPTGLIDWEVKTVTAGLTAYVQFPASIDMIDRFC